MKSISFLSITFCAGAAVLLGGMTAHGQQPCSTEKVNGDCTFTIDRTNPLQPPTLQMYPGKTVTVRIVNALPFEQVSLDWQSSTGSLTPDQASAIFNALSASLQKLTIANATPPPLPQPPPPGPVGPEIAVPPNQDQCAGAGATTAACAAQIIRDARMAVVDIGSLVNDDTLVYSSQTELPVPRTLADFDNVRTRILCRILGTDLQNAKKLNGVTTIDCAAEPTGQPFHDIVAEQQTLTNSVSTPPNGSNLPALIAYTNTLVGPLEAIAQDLIQLSSAQTSDGVLGTIVDPGRSANVGPPSCNSSLSTNPDRTVYVSLLQRQVVCAVNVYNLVANSIASVPTSTQKRTIVIITVNYADTRIETSAGIMVSALPSRSFAANPVYTGTPPAVSNMVVHESDTRPLVLPYAAVHVRLGQDWLWPDHRRGAVYATFLVGVNPNTTTADLGAGLSISWRTLVLSPVAHFAHDVRLTDGFTNGESLGASFTGSVPTQQFWTTSFGLGIGIRVPLITGR
jgi:hypothetical protein